MGVDTYIYLPKDVRVHEVAEVMGILAGLKPKWAGANGSIWAEVKGASVKGIEIIPGAANIYLEADKGKKFIDGEREHFCMYHYEVGGHYSNYVLLSPRSTALWIAIGIGLCKFFGGGIDYNDCDAGGINRRFPRKRKNNSPDDGKAWDLFQKEIMSIKPLSDKDLEKAEELASYKKA